MKDIEWLKSLVELCNNNSYDYGIEVVEETKDYLKVKAYSTDDDGDDEDSCVHATIRIASAGIELPNLKEDPTGLKELSLLHVTVENYEPVLISSHPWVLLAVLYAVP